MLSVLLRFTDSDYHFGFFKFFLLWIFLCFLLLSTMYWLYSSSLAKSYDPLPLLLTLGHVSCNVAHIVISWITKSTKYIPKNYIVMLFGNNFWQNLNVSILYLQFSYKAHVFVACILICCSYCWLHPIKNYNCVTTKVWLTWPGHMRLDIQVMVN